MSAAGNLQSSASSNSPISRIEAHYRKFLARRWAGLVLRSIILTSFSLFLIPGILISWRYSFLTATSTLFIFGPITYLLGTHLILRAKRSLIISPPKFSIGKPTAYTTFSTTLTPRILLYLLSHAIFGAVFTIAYAGSMEVRDPSVSLGWLASTPRHPWHGNERLWFLLSAHTLFSLTVGFRDVLAGHITPQWPKQRSRFAEAVKQSFLEGIFGQAGLISDASLAFAWSLVYSSVYFTFRRPAWQFVLTHFSLLRPFMINFTKSSRNNLTWSLTYHLIVLQLTALISLRPSTSVVNAYSTQPLRFDSFTRKSPLTPDRYLLTALQTSNPYYLNFTIMEIQRVSHIPLRRKAIFADLTKTPTLMHEVWNELLIQLGNSFQTLKTRGGTMKSISTTSSVPEGSGLNSGSKDRQMVDPHAIPVKQADIFRPITKQKSTLELVVQSVLDPSKPSSSSLTNKSKAIPTLSAAASTSKKIEQAVLKRIEQPVEQAEHWAEGVPVIGYVISGSRSMIEFSRNWAGEMWAKRNVEGSVPELDRLERIVDAIVTLSIASIEEDTYGLVQSVLPATLEVFVRFRMAVIGLENELTGKAGKDDVAVAQIRMRTGRVINVFDDGVRRIGEAFGSSLSAFRFPSVIAHSLTEICRDPISSNAIASGGNEKS